MHAEGRRTVPGRRGKVRRCDHSDSLTPPSGTFTRRWRHPRACGESRPRAPARRQKRLQRRWHGQCRSACWPDGQSYYVSILGGAPGGPLGTKSVRLAGVDLEPTSRGSKVGFMTRTGPSAADTALIEELSKKGLKVSAAQLERWRAVGVVPRNRRTHLGRGKGSKSTGDDVGAGLVEAMAMVSRNGRSVHEAVLRLFTVDPRSQDLYERRLPISEKAIRSAFDWFVRHGDQSVHRRIERALKRTKTQGDAAADLIARIASRHYRNTALLHPPPTAEHRPPTWTARDEQSIQLLTALTIGNFLGVEEIGTQKLAEILADGGPSTATNEDRKEFGEKVAKILAARELTGGEPLRLSAVPTMDDTIRRLKQTDLERILKLRDKIALVAQVGYIYLKVRGAADFQEFSRRILDASTETIDANMLLYAATPIAATLKSSAWHTMSGLIIMILMEDDATYSNTLDNLVRGVVPERLAHRFIE
ncbi:hypothetical protein SUDANB108_03061 [Streptomyces sp. enrichment culture]